MKRRLMYFFPPDDGVPAGGGGGGTPPVPTPGSVPQGRLVTDDEIQRIAAREKAQGERSGTKTVLETLGFTTAEEAKKFVEEQRAAQAAAMTEQQRQAAETAAQKQEAERTKAEAAAATARANRTVALVAAGVQPGENGVNLEDALALLHVPADADTATVTTAIEALKTRRPELFVAAPPAPRQPPLPNGAPAQQPPPNGSTGGTVPGAKGKAEAARRFAKTKAGATA